MREPNAAILGDLLERAKQPPALHVGTVLRDHGIDRADALAWTRCGSRASRTRHAGRTPSVVHWYVTLREYAAWHFLVDLDAFAPDEALDVVLSYELANVDARRPVNRTLVAMEG